MIDSESRKVQFYLENSIINRPYMEADMRLIPNQVYGTSVRRPDI